MSDRLHNSVSAVMDDGHYPGLYQSANAASFSAQKTYLILQWVYLSSLILGSVIGATRSLATMATAVWWNFAIALVLILSLLVLWVMRSRNDIKAWFDCRAIAESAKTVTWRFIMGVPPFSKVDSVETRFISVLREIRETRHDSFKVIARQLNTDSSAITGFMTDMRACPFDERKGFYIEYRLRDQKAWYSRNARMNANGEACWLWIIMGLQAIAVTIAVIETAFGGFPVNTVPVLTTCAAAFVAWSQMKRHSELAQSFALAGQELGDLDSIAASITDEDQFHQLVEQVEETISREHTMWCARRDVRLMGNGRR